MYNSNYFEDMGLYYLGPIDGNDYEMTRNVLREAKRAKQSVIVHIKTKKGKGYKAAEMYPGKYHGIKPIDSASAENEKSFSKVFGEAVTDMAEKYSDICAVTAAMSTGTGLDGFEKQFPNRFFDVGIAEEHALTFCAGLAADGLKPIFAVYSSFLQRGYDNIVHDIALQCLPVTICIDRAGLNTSDGATHHGIFDVSFLSHIPNVEIYTPATYSSLKQAFYSAYMKGYTAAIRYSSGAESELVHRSFPNEEKYSLARADYSVEDNPEAVIITYGTVCEQAILAKRELENDGVSCGIILLQKLKPYRETVNEIRKLLPKKCSVLYLEEGIINGGASMIIGNMLKEDERIKKSIICGIDDDFVCGEKERTYYESAGIDKSSIVNKVKTMLGR